MILYLNLTTSNDDCPAPDCSAMYENPVDQPYYETTRRFLLSPNQYLALCSCRSYEPAGAYTRREWIEGLTGEEALNGRPGRESMSNARPEAAANRRPVEN